MADGLVSALATVVLEYLSSSIQEELSLARGLKTEIEDIQKTLVTIQAVLWDAEEKQWKSEALKQWLIDLKDAAYDVKDLLDEVAIQAEWRRQRRGTVRGELRSFFSLHHNTPMFRQKLAHKLRKVGRRLDGIAQRRQNFHPIGGAMEMEADNLDQRQTGSQVNESEIYGRGREKEELINRLLASLEDFSVHVICGIEGLGKTALAQLVYNDRRTKQHFDLQIWTCVPAKFKINRLLRAILESIDDTSSNIQELDVLQRRLQEKLRGKKFLLTLDDVWDDYHDNWNKLKDLLRCGAEGSAVIVTTRSQNIANDMATARVQHIGTLSNVDSWQLFRQFAFGTRRREEYDHLVEIGMAIVRKCGGVPLATRALGSLMRSKELYEREWSSVEKREIWDLPKGGDQILPALLLSYMNLKPQLKQCFAFCSIFPKDYVMEKEQLIALWIANGFIYGEGQMDLHDKGHEIFNDLIGISRFQEVVDDGLGNITCKMHDLIHDLAQFVVKHECCLIEGNKRVENPKTIRHAALNGRSTPTRDAKLQGKNFRVSKLHSLLFLNGSYLKESDTFDLFQHSKKSRLRALDISRCNQLPKFVCDLKHLRYLNVSYSSIKTLPESITTLQNLQTLDLKNCTKLQKLPNDTSYLTNLVNLDNKGCDLLRSMPERMRHLSYLRKLSMFVVGNEDGHHIGELERLNLGGELRIKDLDNVKSKKDAREAALMEKKNLQSLSLCWREDRLGNERYEQVLSGLQPNSNLKRLEINGYQGSNFQDWMMNSSQQLPNLVEMELIACRNCERLPPFGKLQFLKHLRLKQMTGVKCIGNDVYGDDHEGNHPCQSLETLHLHSMNRLEHWTTIRGRECFPCLRQIDVNGCPMLIEFPVMPSVRTLEIAGACTSTLLRSVRNLTSLTSLGIAGVSNRTLLPDGMLQNNTFLEELRIADQRNLQSLSNQILDNLAALKSLTIWRCDQLESLPERGLRNLNSLEKLEIYGCHRLKSLPANGLDGLSSLQFLHIRSCKKFSSLPDQIGYLESLSRLYIRDCPELLSFPDWVKCLTKLKELLISGCPYLERRCKKERGEDWPMIAHIPKIIINDEVIQQSLD